jgi:cytidylate kinase
MAMARGIEQIVNERVLEWEVQRRSTTPPPPSGVEQTTPAQRPMVTISRECGSLGGELGRRVAERLGFTFYSQELVHEIASAAHVRSAAVASFDEHPRGTLEVMVREIIDGEAFAARDYLHYLRAVLSALGRKGRGVVVGRGGHLVLDPTLTLRVRTYASAPRRAGNLAERQGSSTDDALTFLRRIDRERAAFYRQHFGVDWMDPGLFDLCLNTETLTLEESASIVVAAYQTRFADPG